MFRRFYFVRVCSILDWGASSLFSGHGFLSPKLVVPPHLFKVAMKVKFSGLPRVSEPWLGVGKGVLLLDFAPKMFFL